MSRTDSGLLMFGASMCALAAMVGCALLSPVESPASDARACYLAALEPAVGDVAEPVLAAIMAGGDPIKILRAHRVSFDDIAAVAAAFNACAGEEPPPAELSPSLQDL